MSKKKKRKKLKGFTLFLLSYLLMSFIMDISSFFNRASQQVSNALNRVGTWARTKGNTIRRTRKTEENSQKSKRMRFSCIFVYLFLCICVCGIGKYYNYF